jgi:hypothetical protein
MICELGLGLSEFCSKVIEKIEKRKRPKTQKQVTPKD